MSSSTQGITAETSVGEIASQNPTAVRVFEKVGVDYCCGGGKSLQSVCAEQNIDFDDLVARLEAAAQEATVQNDGRDWSVASLGEVIDEILDRHHTYVRNELPRLNAIIAKVASRHADNQAYAAILQNCEALTAELSTHMLKEEQVLFPYLRQMEISVNRGHGVPPAFFGTVQRPVQAMMLEHDGAGDLLKQIRQLSNDYTPPQDACATTLAMFAGLEEFERDLHRHIHLENNILFPRAVKMEQEGGR
jgi:regulator of cell morphogenesis and NO signaling